MIPARRVVTGTPASPRSASDLTAVAQVRGQVVGILAEAAEVDDPLHARFGGGVGERAGRGVVTGREIGVSEGVHQVEGDLTPGEGREQGRLPWTSPYTACPAPG